MDGSEEVTWRLKAEALQTEVLRLNGLLAGNGGGGSSSLILDADEDQAVRRRPYTTATTTDLETVILLDPLVANEMKMLRHRLYQSEQALRNLKEDLQVMTNFSTEGPLGRRLLEKCRKLMKENEQLGEALISAKVATADQTLLFQAEKENFLISQLKLLHEFNADLESECANLIKSVNRLAAANQTLKTDNEKLETQVNDLLRRLERDRSPAANRSAAGRHRGGGASPRRRERSPSFEKHGDRRRRRGE